MRGKEQRTGTKRRKRGERLKNEEDEQRNKEGQNLLILDLVAWHGGEKKAAKRGRKRSCAVGHTASPKLTSDLLMSLQGVSLAR